MIMPEKEKYHFNKGEVKSSIIEFVLGMDGKVSEPEIRKHLEDKFGVIAQGTINRHLHDLLKASCLELFPPEKKGFRNHWGITKMKTLTNIKEKFPGIQIKNYTKAKDLIIQKNLRDNKGRLYKKYFIYMSLFPSFFPIFLNNEFKQLFKKADALWKIENYRDQDHKRHLLYDKICRHFYETDFLTGKSNEDTKKFIDELEERIKNVNDAYNTTPSIENTRPARKFQAAVDELDALYDEWYEKCL
jgi:hypothetical protein